MTKRNGRMGLAPVRLGRGASKTEGRHGMSERTERSEGHERMPKAGTV